MALRKRPKKGMPDEFPSNADGDSVTSVAIARAIFDQIQTAATRGGRLAGQISGSKFEQITRSFVQETFSALKALRPGKWDFNPEKRAIFRFEQYRHLAELSDARFPYPEIAHTVLAAKAGAQPAAGQRERTASAQAWMEGVCSLGMRNDGF
jgi:hypothetical protein